MNRTQQLRVLCAGREGFPAVQAELRKGGYQIVCEHVSTAEELESALARPWDVAFAGARGDLAGLAVLAAAHRKGVDLPLIVISGRIKDSEVVALFKAGAVNHFTPRTLDGLKDTVERVLAAARSRRERDDRDRQSQKMEAIGRLAGGVAHDFNNLLTVITGYSDLLLASRDLKDSQRSALEEIRRSAERGGSLTHQLLSFSRRQPLELRTVRANELLIELEKMLKRLIGEHIELITIAQAGMDAVEVDPGRLEQVIVNLAVNARDAMPNGGKLTIETSSAQIGEFSAGELSVKPGQYVIISISDTGVGMDDDVLSHVFEPFFTTKARGRGTGLGLATAYGIIRQIGGAINFTSEVGAGTTAKVYLPCVQHEAPAQPGTAPRPKPGNAETILVVEDETRVRKLIVDVLTAHRYQVLEASRGPDALALCESRKDPIHLAIVDVVMPEMSGPDLVRKIAIQRPDMNVLYISGYTDEAVMHHGIQETSTAFLQKPFLPDALARKVREVLDSRTSTAERQR